MVLARLLPELFARGHKVLIFSQFVTMLDILETWAEESQGWVVCRIDGSSSSEERREQMGLFQRGKDNKDTDPTKAPMLFLLSTRAGGLGINLTAADTVIFYDQDWVRFCRGFSTSWFDLTALFLLMISTESTNGLTSSRPGPSYWTDQAGAHLPSSQRAYDRRKDYAARQ
jgi:hypothetical protein